MEWGEEVRALVLPGDKSAKYVPAAVEITVGNEWEAQALINERLGFL